MASRLNLHEELCDLLGTRNVYFQPPASVEMKYPCIRYSRPRVDLQHANNKIYANTNQYEVILIDFDPDSKVFDKILNQFKMCSFDAGYTADNLNHFKFTIYY
jgi:hypothetical protein